MSSFVECKLVILGDGGVGKSALTIRYVVPASPFLEEYDPTIEDCYRKDEVIDGEQLQLSLLDTAGQDEFASMQDEWISQGDGFLLVYSCVSRQSFDKMKNIYDKLIRTKEAAGITHVPIVVAANKADLTDKQVNFEEGNELARKWGAKFFEVSALTKLNVETVFVELVRDIRRIQKSTTTTEVKPRIRCSLI